MKKINSAILFILSFLFFGGCADSVSDLNTKNVSVTVENANLNIRNNFNHPIYYFAIESGRAVVIQWATVASAENRVKSRETKQIPLNEIYAFKPGDEILLYYWSKKDPGSKNIKFQRIETK